MRILQSMDNDAVIRRKASNVSPRRIFGRVYKNFLEWRLRQNEELCESLDRLDTLKFVKLKKKLQ